MANKKCIYCNKELPEGTDINVCSLCAIGLIPAMPADDTVSIPQQATQAVEGRQLSGVHCPGCNAEFSLADISNCHCSICGAVFSPERINALVNASQFEQHKLPDMSVRTNELGVKSWPDDAPLW